MTKSFFNSKNPISTYFWPISPIFGSKKKYSQKIRLCRTTAVEWHSKVKNIEYDVCLTKIYCFTACKKSTQFINPLFRSSRFYGLVN